MNETIETRMLPRGVTHEKLFFETGKLELSGCGREESTLSWADGAYAPDGCGGKTGTFRSYTAFLGGKAVYAHDLTIENRAGGGDTAGQAVAVYADASLVYMENVHLFSRQDTLFCAPLPQAEREPGGFRGPREHAPRRRTVQYYRNCLIEGDVDFIFGGADAVFDACEIRSLDKGLRCNGYAAAPSGPADGLGFVFRHCRFTSDGAAPGTVYLARPWRPSGRAAFLSCELGAHIAPPLVHVWHPGDTDEPEAGFAVYACIGPGMSPEAAHAPFLRTLEKTQAKALSLRADEAAAAAMAPWNQ